MQNVNEIMHEELEAFGLDVDRLDNFSQDAIQALAPTLDNALVAVADNPEALRIAAAALRAYARVAEQYAAGLEAYEARGTNP